MTAEKVQQIQYWEFQEAEYAELCERFVTAAQAQDYFAAGEIAVDAGRQCARATAAMVVVVTDAAVHLTVGELAALEARLEHVANRHAGLWHRIGEWLPPGGIGGGDGDE